MCGEKVYTSPQLAKPVAMAPQAVYDAIPGILTGSAGTTSFGMGVLPAGAFNEPLRIWRAASVSSHFAHR